MKMQENLTAPDQVAAIAGRLLDKAKAGGGLRRVYCVACGGSLGGLYPLDYLIRTETKSLFVTSVTANEFVHATPAGVDANALVVVMSMAGTTPETVRAAHRAKELGAAVLALSSKKEVPLTEGADEIIVYGAENCSWQQTNQALLLKLGGELLHRCEGWAGHEQLQQALGQLDDVCGAAIQKAAAPALQFAQLHRDDEVIYTVGSGPMSRLAYTTCICHLMEMEWINSSSFHSGEFFHGPFEITDKGVPFLLFLSGGRTRFLDERAGNFLARYTDQLERIDARDYGMDRLPAGVAEFFEPVVLGAVARVYTTTLAREKKHPFLYRKYMFKVEY